MAQDPAAPPPNDSAELAKKLSNPVAALISVPLQNNFEFGGGPNDEGFRYLLNFQPVVPITLNTNWNLISRTIVPVIQQNDLIGTTRQGGLGDIVQSAFFSPKQPGPGGLIWGVGPVFLFPSATDSLLGSEKLGLGPTAVLLKQEHGWTYGALVNQIWSVAGNDNRDEVNATFLQPFISYTTPKQTTFTINSESTYDWEHEQWTTPVNLMVGQLVKVGGTPVQFQVGGKYYVAGPDAAPDWGIRFSVTLLFPK
ncbi:MAG: transporter [Verrucomicrobiae bacterium]|nr:transporter [Verrucomicrobiae bacterium]